MAISASIQALLTGEQVAGSKLNSKLLDELLAEGLLLVVSRGSRKSYRARDMEALKRFLIDKDEAFRILEVNASDSRALMATETGNSKLVMVRSCPGFPVNSYEPIECFLDRKPLVVSPQEGSFLFVSDWEKFTIPEDVVVVGIENMENFRMIRRQRTFFDLINISMITVFQIKYFSYLGIHNRLILENGYVLSQIIIFTSGILI